MMKRIHDTEPALPDCAAQYFGHWLCHLPWLSDAVAAYRAGDLKPKVSHVLQCKDALSPEQRLAIREAWDAKPHASNVVLKGMGVSVVEDSAEGPRVLYVLDDSGIATITIEGQTQKHDSSFGGTSTVRTRRAIRLAADDDEVLGIMLRFDQAPGGTVAGAAQLADDIASVAKIKPVHAHGDDMVASAAVWFASQASRFTASRSTEIGSIGVIAVVEDSSGAAEQAGIVVHKVSTGEFKGGIVPGTPVTEEDLTDIQREVDAINELFAESLGSGRGMSGERVRAVSTGQVWLAAEARGLGLIDGVETFDQAHAHLAAVVGAIKNERAVSADRTRRARAALALGR